MSLECGTIFTREQDLREGLFGGVFLFMLEVLPLLHERGIRPHWRIDTACYGNVVPDVLEPVDPDEAVLPEIPLTSLRDLDRRAMGGDFEGISRLWSSYFRPAPAVLEEADRVDPGLDRALGIHYRGRDKLKASWDTNPIDREDFVSIVVDRIAADPVFDRCLIAGDDQVFIDLARRRIDLPVTVLDAGEGHKSPRSAGRSGARGLMAFRDAILLSRCRSILQTSSALPSFARVLRPEVDCRRCAASKWFGEIPYFPVAYIPPHQPEDPRLRSVVEKAMQDDWSVAAGVESSVWDSAHLPRSAIARPVARRHGWRRFLTRGPRSS